ncbi:MAG: biotin--[acetyl-CoA-carboxylase] ligase [Muribaculaceae bacterium]
MPRYIHLHETASTNTYLSRMAQMLPSGTVIYTYKQTAGRGQRGNSWESEPGKNLSFSLITKDIAVSPAEQFLVSEAASLAVADFLKEYVGDITVKWPNDVYYRDKKICGMLIEHSLQGARIKSTITGIGINVNQTEFVSNAPNPVSLAQITGKEYDLDELLHKVCERVEKYLDFASYTSEQRADLHRRYLAALYRCDGQFHTFATPMGDRSTLAPVTINPEGWNTFEARIDDVKPDGTIVLVHRDGTSTGYAFKEVAFVL